MNGKTIDLTRAIELANLELDNPTAHDTPLLRKAIRWLYRAEQGKELYKEQIKINAKNGIQ